MLIHSSVIRCTQSMYSIMERVTALGWADELSKMDYPDCLKDHPYIGKFCQTDITDRGNFFQFTQFIFSHKAIKSFKLTILSTHSWKTEKPSVY